MLTCACTYVFSYRLCVSKSRGRQDEAALEARGCGPVPRADRPVPDALHRRRFPADAPRILRGSLANPPGVFLCLYALPLSPLASMPHAHVRANAFAQEKLRQRGIYVAAAPDLQQPLEAPVQARQPRIDEFFPRAVQG